MISFLNKTDFDIKETTLYKEKLASIVENETFKKATGWKVLPELINGRAAMLGEGGPCV